MINNHITLHTIVMSQFNFVRVDKYFVNESHIESISPFYSSERTGKKYLGVRTIRDRDQVYVCETGTPECKDVEDIYNSAVNTPGLEPNDRNFSCIGDYVIKWDNIESLAKGPSGLIVRSISNRTYPISAERYQDRTEDQK
jgi:hypothetical protein